eukprot:7109129-Prymnesium_polylepis.1
MATTEGQLVGVHVMQKVEGSKGRTPSPSRDRSGPDASSPSSSPSPSPPQAPPTGLSTWANEVCSSGKWPLRTAAAIIVTVLQRSKGRRVEPPPPVKIDLGLKRFRRPRRPVLETRLGGRDKTNGRAVERGADTVGIEQVLQWR